MDQSTLQLFREGTSTAAQWRNHAVGAEQQQLKGHRGQKGNATAETAAIVDAAKRFSREKFGPIEAFANWDAIVGLDNKYGGETVVAGHHSK